MMNELPRCCRDCGASEIDKDHKCSEGQEKLEWMIEHLRRMGFTKGWKPSFNVNQRGFWLLDELPEIGGDDWVWMCNQLGRIHKHTYDCMDNMRICAARHYNDQPTIEYETIKQNGCCGFFDEQLTNPKTENTFWYGFNYGH